MKTLPSFSLKLAIFALLSGTVEGSGVEACANRSTDDHPPRTPKTSPTSFCAEDGTVGNVRCFLDDLLSQCPTVLERSAEDMWNVKRSWLGEAIVRLHLWQRSDVCHPWRSDDRSRVEWVVKILIFF